MKAFVSTVVLAITMSFVCADAQTFEALRGEEATGSVKQFLAADERRPTHL